MAIQEVVNWSTTPRDNVAHHPVGPDGRTAVRSSLSFQQMQAAIARWRDTLTHPVDSVFGRTGAVTALQADYDAFFLTPAEGDALFLTPAEGNAAYSALGHSHDHTALTSIGTNTHAQIDTAISNSVAHLADTSIHTEDNLLAHLAGAETITGAKTFSAADTWFGASGIRIDASEGIYFEDNKHAITWNDGAGNFNIRVGNTDQGSGELCTEAGYAMKQEYTQSTGTLLLEVSSASLAVDDPIAWRSQVSITPTAVALRYAASTKIATTTGGVSVTGDIAVTGTVDGIDIATDVAANTTHRGLTNPHLDWTADQGGTNIHAGNYINTVYSHPNHSGDVTSAGDGAQTIGAKKVTLAMMADGIDGELFTWNTSGVAAKVAVGTSTHILTSNGAGAAPTFQAVPGGGADSVGQSELKTAGQTVSTGSNTYLIATGGIYCMGHTLKIRASGGTWVELNRRSNDTSQNAEWQFTGDGAGSGTVVLYYVNSSPPYDMGEGYCHQFVYAMVDNTTKEIMSMSISRDPIWIYNGPTNLRPSRYDRKTGVAYRTMRDMSAFPITLAQAMELGPDAVRDYSQAFSEASLYEEEITQELKHRDMNSVPHVFKPVVGQTRILLDPISPVMRRLKRMHQHEGVGDLTAFVKNYMKFGNTQLVRTGPAGILIPSVSWKKTI